MDKGVFIFASETYVMGWNAYGNEMIVEEKRYRFYAECKACGKIEEMPLLLEQGHTYNHTCKEKVKRIRRGS